MPIKKTTENFLSFESLPGQQLPSSSGTQGLNFSNSENRYSNERLFTEHPENCRFQENRIANFIEKIEHGKYRNPFII